MRQQDERVVIRSTGANTRRPLQDGYDDRGQNCEEYIALMFGPGTRLKAATTGPPLPTFPPGPLNWMGAC